MKILNLFIFPLTFITGLLLTAGGLSIYVHPSLSEWMPLLGLAFPFLYVLNILLLIYWWIQLKLKLIIPLCFGIFNLIHVSKYVQYTGKSRKGPSDISVGTFNAQLFGVMDDQNHFAAVKERLGKDSFDILCLQEVYSQKALKARIQELRKNGNFRMYSFYRQHPDRPYGMAIFSKHRIVGSGRVGMGNNTGNMAIYADIIIGADTVRVYNLHLQSIRFKRSDYDFIRKTDQLAGGTMEGSRNLVKRLMEAYPKRAAQADSVAEHMETCRYPLIVAGDLNDVPLSYTYNRISKGKLDAFREKGRGFEQTYKGPFPNFRIDYILYSKAFTCTTYQSYSDIAGDHKLVRATFSPALAPQ